VTWESVADVTAVGVASDVNTRTEVGAPISGNANAPTVVRASFSLEVELSPAAASARAQDFEEQK
jgi:hypothetical protein